jgi:hypothetical protein
MAVVLCRIITSLPAPFFVQASRTISLPSAVAVWPDGSSGLDGTTPTRSLQFVAMRTSSKYTSPGRPELAPAASRTVLTQPTSLLVFARFTSQVDGSSTGTAWVPIL